MSEFVLHSLKLPAGYKFHHVGYATDGIAREKEFFSILGYVQEGEIFSDPAQGVAGCFLVGPGPRVELLENLSGAQTLTPWLNASIKIYHFAYFVDDMDEALRWAHSQRARVIASPIPAIAFSNRHISFVMLRNGLMIEFIQSN